MKPILNLSLVVFLMFICVYCSESNLDTDPSKNTSQNTNQVQKNSDIQIPINTSQTYTDGSKRFQLTFSELIEDSRCPENTNCVWQGRVVVKLLVNNNPVVLALGDLRDIPPLTSLKNKVVYEGYQIQLKKVEQTEQYSCTLNIEKVTTQEEDYQHLLDLFNEIEQLSNSVACTDASEWTFAAYGTKACGGWQGYIAYSTTIDTALLLQKVKNYTEKEAQYNTKWEIFSTCDIAAEPTGVICEQNLPILIY